jgi:hypothetical protein
MVARRKVGVKDTPTKDIMNIYLLSIPFAVLGVAMAVVPLIIGMKHDARTRPEKMDKELVSDGSHHQRERAYEKEYEHAA